jgi:hypothetical protein
LQTWGLVVLSLVDDLNQCVIRPECRCRFGFCAFFPVRLSNIRFMRRSLKSPAVALFTIVLLVLLATTLFSLRPMSAAIPNSVFFSLLHPGTGPQLNAQQGDTVALDGNIAAVGAPRDATGGYSSGVVKIYDASNGVLLFTLTNPPRPVMIILATPSLSPAAVSS